ncbi:MAG TPA: CHAD domain-containing protein [Chitinophagaceae bacterium]
MNRKALSEDINQRFVAINRSAKKMVAHFDKDMLLDFRITVQKLRSFLNLICVETVNGADTLKIRRRLKSFYGYAGIIRNIQIQLHHINKIIPDNSFTGLDPYIGALQRDMEGWKHEAIAMLTDHDDFDEEKNIISKSIPAQLTKLSIRKFIIRNADQANELLILRNVDENNLHQLRKITKDIFYNWPYIEEEATNLLPPGINSYERISALTSILNMYGEECAALDLLLPSYTAAVQDEAAKKLLHDLRLKLQGNKEDLRIEFYDNLLKFRSAAISPGHI